jgi:hypothetical protein
MFAKYNTELFPIVKVDLSGTIKSDDDFADFTNNWLNLYNNERDFTFEFDTKNVGLVNPKYCIYVALFIQNLKKRKTQYLKCSSIYVYNKYVYNLLKFIFSIQSPVAPIQLIYVLKNGLQQISHIK